MALTLRGLARGTGVGSVDRAPASCRCCWSTRRRRRRRRADGASGHGARRASPRVRRETGQVFVARPATVFVARLATALGASHDRCGCGGRWGARHVHLNVMLDGLAVLVSRCSAAGCDARGYGSGRESVGGPRRIDFATRGGVHFTAGGRSKSRAGESGSGPARQGVCPARRTVASTQTSHDQAIGEAGARA